jgi:hypothetical protein
VRRKPILEAEQTVDTLFRAGSIFKNIVGTADVAWQAMTAAHIGAWAK